MFSAPKLIFIGTEGLDSHIHVFRSRTRFRKYRGRRVPFSCFAHPDSFSAVLRASGPVFIFIAHEHIFGAIVGVGSLFHVLRYRTHFRQYRGRRVPFSYFALPDSFSTIEGASGPVFMFCFPGLVFGGTMGFRFLLHVLRCRAHFRRSRIRRVPFSCFALPNSFWSVSWASGPFLMFCALGLVFGGSEGVRSSFHVWRSRTRFWRYRASRVPFLCFALPNTFWAVPWASGPFFMVCAAELVFGGTEGVGSYF
jgi:hypothetical protein